MSSLQPEDQIGGGLRTIRKCYMTSSSCVPKLGQLGVREVLSDTSRRVAASASCNGCPLFWRLLFALRQAQSFVKGFSRDLLVGVEPRAVRIISMRARNVAGTCRCPG